MMIRYMDDNMGSICVDCREPINTHALGFEQNGYGVMVYFLRCDNGSKVAIDRLPEPIIPLHLGPSRGE